ncbi:putative pre-16S rRNA nuclease [Roseibium aquae]|uniref:Putative pre-16S rRNA nuclease n=1 Tax=Roseibium aquae TaxID=1323746 RepID=A0A916TMA5_9HYPH|nr:Holliday junction resolvase RuvX [Roseibium aquae]GGB58856.1 putative pre-16S rRNA nuclease [Roseibium aquae]
MTKDAALSLDEFLSALPKSSRLIGLDLGTKTIGLALSDLGRGIATPLDTIRRKKFTQDAEQLIGICKTHHVGGLVMGLPLNMDGTEGPRAQATRSFVRNLSQKTEIPVTYWDERLSTAAVTRTLIEADSSRAKRASVVDKMAAAYILQGFLDRLGHMSPADHTHFDDPA